jgi:hypothetical protein
MDQRSLSYRDSNRAVWRRFSSFALVACVALLAVGCSTGDDPVAPSSTPDELAGLDYEVIQGTQFERDTAGAVASFALVEPYLGRWLVEGTDASYHVYIVPGMPLQFFWHDVGGLYLNYAESYRYGWDVSDADDPNDPGWCVPAGNAEENYHTEEMVFWDGLHELTVERRDGDRLMVRVVFGVSAVPVRDRPADPIADSGER